MKHIHISEIPSITVERPTYVLVAGGIAIGKNHVINKHLRNVQVMDVDHIMEEFGYTDYDGHEYKDAMSIIRERINIAMNNNESFIAMGTAANLQFTINRLLWAKLKGYTTVLLHIDGAYHQAIKQNEERKNRNQRFVADKDLHKIEMTYENSAHVVSSIKETDLVDYFSYYFNERD